MKLLGLSIFGPANRAVKQFSVAANNDMTILTPVTSWNLDDHLSLSGDYKVDYSKNLSLDIKEIKTIDGESYSIFESKMIWKITISGIFFKESVDADNFILFMANSPKGDSNAFRVAAKILAPSGGYYYDMLPTLNNDCLLLEGETPPTPPDPAPQKYKFYGAHMSSLKAYSSGRLKMVDLEFTATVSIV